jgi:hypothetical protein
MRALAAAVLLATAWGAPAAFALPMVWTVRGPDCTLTLFGSIHVLPGGVEWEPPALAQALTQADELWFEIPLGDADQAAAIQAAQAQGFLPQGEALSHMLSPAGEERLADFARQNHLDAAKLDRMQPWFADLLVSSMAYAKDGANQDAGVEASLLKSAPQARRRAFETAAQQMAMLIDSSRAAQLASLESSLKEAQEDPQAYHDLLAAWLKGDERRIYQHDVLPLKTEAPAMFQRLIIDRNAAWTRTLAERLKGRGHVVVVVGAGHLIGPDGVPARLKALGFKVDGPTD